MNISLHSISNRNTSESNFYRNITNQGNSIVSDKPERYTLKETKPRVSFQHQIENGRTLYCSEMMTINYVSKDGDTLSLRFNYEQARNAQLLMNNQESSDEGSQEYAKFDVHLKSNMDIKSIDRNIFIRNGEKSDELKAIQTDDELNAGVSMLSDEWKEESSGQHLLDILTWMASFTDDKGEGFLNGIVDRLNQTSLANGLSGGNLRMQYTDPTSGDSLTIGFEGVTNTFSSEPIKLNDKISSPEEITMETLSQVKNQYTSYRAKQISSFIKTYSETHAKDGIDIYDKPVIKNLLDK